VLCVSFFFWCFFFVFLFCFFFGVWFCVFPDSFSSVCLATRSFVNSSRTSVRPRRLFPRPLFFRTARSLSPFPTHFPCAYRSDHPVSDFRRNGLALHHKLSTMSRHGGFPYPCYGSVLTEWPQLSLFAVVKVNGPVWKNAGSSKVVVVNTPSGSLIGVSGARDFFPPPSWRRPNFPERMSLPRR